MDKLISKISNSESGQLLLEVIALLVIGSLVLTTNFSLHTIAKLYSAQKSYLKNSPCLINNKSFNESSCEIVKIKNTGNIYLCSNQNEFRPCLYLIEK